MLHHCVDRDRFGPLGVQVFLEEVERLGDEHTALPVALKAEVRRPLCEIEPKFTHARLGRAHRHARSSHSLG
jgi:hypothetical protein